MGVFVLVVFKVILGSFSTFVSIWPVTLKRLAVEQKWLRFGTRGTLVTHIWNIFDLVVFKGHLGVIWCILKMAFNPETGGCIAKKTDIWDSGMQVTHTCIMGYIWSCRVQIIWGSFGALASKCSVSQNWLIVEWNEVKFGTREIYHYSWIIYGSPSAQSHLTVTVCESFKC